MVASRIVPARIPPLVGQSQTQLLDERLELLRIPEDAATPLAGQLAAAGQVQEGFNGRAFNQLGVGHGLLAGYELFMSRPDLQLRQQTLVFGGHKGENQAQTAFAFFTPGFREISALPGLPGGGSALKPEPAPEFSPMISPAGNRDKAEIGEDQPGQAPAVGATGVQANYPVLVNKWLPIA